MKTPFREELFDVDFCVVGGGLAGLFAAVAAARHGAKVLLMNDRPVLGGNASSEVRMWVGGAGGKDTRETGLLEELMLDNHYYNPDRNFSVWDSLLYGMAYQEPNLKLALNTSCCRCEMDGVRIVSVTGWQLTSQKWITVKARVFADCSGDSVLAPLTGAEFTFGRESRERFGESIEPIEGDVHTMGNSCLLQARETTHPKPFIPPPWAYKFDSPEKITRKMGNFNCRDNFWWMELGGMQDTIHDAEEIRDELLKVAFGVWDYYKNHAEKKADNWDLEWVGFLPGKRESRRYIGDHVTTQNDLLAGGRFGDVVAYGGWPMDDHDVMGFATTRPPNHNTPVPSPYGIPYRSLYSRNIENLLFAGRNISVSHAALSSTRVMATCAVIGQAAGTAAAIAVREGVTPREVSRRFTRELQQMLLDDDAYIPWASRDIPELSRRAKLMASDGGDPSALRNGVDRPVDGVGNDYRVPLNGWVAYEFDAPAKVTAARIVFDSDLNRNGGQCHYNILSNFPLERPQNPMPKSLVRKFRVEVQGPDGTWVAVADVADNRRRMVKVPLGGVEACAVRVVPETTWGEGAADARLFAFDVR